MIYLMSSPRLPSFGQWIFSPLTTAEVKALIETGNYISAIGHLETARFLSSLFDLPIPKNRITVRLTADDIGIVLGLKTRLAENQGLSAAMMMAEDYFFGKLKLIKGDI